MNTEQSKPLMARQAARARGDKFYKASKPCAKHGGYERYVSNGGCPKCHRESRDKYLIEHDHQHPSPYYTGRNARSKGRPKMPPMILGMEQSHWWLAGWNERDMELSA